MENRLNYDIDSVPPKGFAGIWEVYFRSGGILVRNTFQNGRRHGLQQCFYEDGTLAQEGQCVGGHNVGEWIDYHPNGRKALVATYAPGGVMAGIWREYDMDTGHITEETEYHNDQEDGAYRVYAGSNGELLAEGEYQDGLPWNGVCCVTTANSEEGYGYWALFESGIERKRVMAIAEYTEDRAVWHVVSG